MNLIVRPLFSFLVCTCGVLLIPVVPIASDAWAQVSTRSGGGVASRMISRSTAVVGRVSPTAGALGRSVIGGVRSGASAIGTSTIGVVGVATSVATTGVSTINDVGQSAAWALRSAGTIVSRTAPSLLTLFRSPLPAVGSAPSGIGGATGSNSSSTVFQSLMRPRTPAGSLGSGYSGIGQRCLYLAGRDGRRRRPIHASAGGGLWRRVDRRHVASAAVDARQSILWSPSFAIGWQLDFGRRPGPYTG